MNLFYCSKHECAQEGFLLDIVTQRVTLQWLLFVKKLIWDDWNITHIARHRVTPLEVDEVCHNDPVVAQGKKRRLLVIGYSLNKRMLTILLDPEDQKGVYYPVTARTASKKEQKMYRNEKLGGENT